MHTLSSFFYHHLLHRERMSEGKEKPFIQKCASFFLHRIVPAVGILSYGSFGVHVCNPGLLMRFLSSQSSQKIITCLNYNSHLGLAICLYYRSHIKRSGNSVQRILFPAFAALTFNFSSILIWLMTRDLVHEDWQKAALAIGSSSIMLAIGWFYLNFLDSL